VTEPENNGRSVEEIIGTTIYQDCSQKQRDELAIYTNENPEGVRETARKVAHEEASGRIDSAVPILLSRLRNGQHHRRDKQQTRSDLDIVDFAERRYHAKMRDFAKHHANPNQWGHTEALEYAVDWTIIDRKDCGLTGDELMTKLCRRLNCGYIPRRRPAPSYTEAQVAVAAAGLAPLPTLDEDDDIPGYGDTP
jgi:hypothetical protein